MSSFLRPNAAGVSSLLLRETDFGANFVHRPAPDLTGRPERPWLDGKLWSRSRMSGSDSSMGLAGEDSTNAGRWDEIPEEGGARSCRKIIGTTYDSGGTPLANVVVQAFRSIDEKFVGTTTSDLGGYYECPTIFADQHYLVAYKAGSPDLAGTTVNTLTPV